MSGFILRQEQANSQKSTQQKQGLGEKKKGSTFWLLVWDGFSIMLRAYAT